MGRASSSLAFLRFLSASSEDLGQSGVRGSRGHRRGPSVPVAGAVGTAYTVPPSTHARKSFTSSTVISPVVSSGLSVLLLGESMGPGEKAAGCSSGDPGEPWGREGFGTATIPGQPTVGPMGMWRTWWGQGDHSRSLSLGEHRPSGLQGTWVPFACGSFGVAVKLLLEGNTRRSYCRSRHHGAGVQGCCRSKGPVSPGHISPEAGGVLEPGDLQPAQWLRHVPGTQREALKLGR